MIVQVGPYPPPYGGVSIYIKRIKQLLDSQSINNEVWNIYNECKEMGIRNVKLKFLYKELLRNNNIKIIHYNISGIKGKLYIAIINKLICKNKKLIITLHGDARDLFQRNNWIMKKILNSFDIIICVKKGDLKFLKDKEIKSNIYEIPAFISPKYNEEDYTKLPDNVKKFINESEFLICANGAIKFYNGEDLYGLDMLIEMIYMIRNEFENVKLIFCVLSKEYQTEKESKYYYSLVKKIKLLNLEKYIFLYEVKDTEFHPILSYSKIFIRPTNTDGDAISIREALHLKVPCIASDVINRPDGTILFKNRDIKSLYDEVRDLIINYNKRKREIERNVNLSNSDSSDKILSIYKTLLKDRK